MNSDLYLYGHREPERGLKLSFPLSSTKILPQCLAPFWSLLAGTLLSAQFFPVTGKCNFGEDGEDARAQRREKGESEKASPLSKRSFSSAFSRTGQCGVYFQGVFSQVREMEK